MTAQCDIVILAAGASTRLGRPKQWLPFDDTDLLTHAATIALASQAKNIAVVLAPGVKDWSYVNGKERLHVIVNEHSNEGIASSIRCGLFFLLERDPSIENILFMTCDQPYIDAGLLDKLITLQRQSNALVSATAYADTKGIPAVFNKKLFPELLQLKGDSGARKIIAAQTEAIALVEFSLASIDIDTEADYQALQKSKKT